MFRTCSVKCVSAFLLLALSFLFLPEAGAAEKTARGINCFAFMAAEKLRKGEEDFFFSPWSLASALGMTWAGARGETESQMAQVLGLDSGSARELGRLAEAVTQGRDGSNEAPILCSANRVWVQKELPLEKAYQKTLKEDFKSSVTPLDFLNETREAQRTINDWTEKQTRGLIRNLIQDLNPRTRMVLTNALYFRGKWVHPFSPERTVSRDFRVSAEKTLKVPMMSQTREFSFCEAEGGVKALRLPYSGGLSMLLLLPVDCSTAPLLEKLKSSDSQSFLTQIEDSLAPHLVDLRLPRFRTEGRFEFSRILASLGMPLAFSNAADFSGISSEDSLKIDQVIHQTFIDVDETETEAAAATAVTMMKTTAVRNPLPLAEFHADHPFLYLIQDNATGTILFMGRQGFSQPDQ